jgi:hypothetical protein
MSRKVRFARWCGYNEPHWLKQGWDKEAEYCKYEDSGFNLAVKEEATISGFRYRRTSEKYIVRLPLEIYWSRGNTFNKPKHYWDASNFDKGHQRLFNEKLSS